MRRFNAGLRLDVGGFHGGVGLDNPRIAFGSGADLRRLALADGGALCGDGFALRAHAVDRRVEGHRRQRQTFDPHLQDANPVGGQQLLVDLLTQLVFEIGDTHLIGVGVDQARQIEARGGGLECRADEGADLPRGFVRLVLHGAHEALHVVRIALHLPRHVRLNDDAQAVTGTDVLQTA